MTVLVAAFKDAISMIFLVTVTNKGAQEINAQAVAIAGVTEQQLSSAPFGDPKVHADRIYCKPGLMVRLTHNLDKDRGFVICSCDILRFPLSILSVE